MVLVCSWKIKDLSKDICMCCSFHVDVWTERNLQLPYLTDRGFYWLDYWMMWLALTSYRYLPWIWDTSYVLGLQKLPFSLLKHGSMIDSVEAFVPLCNRICWYHCGVTFLDVGTRLFTGFESAISGIFLYEMISEMKYCVFFRFCYKSLTLLCWMWCCTLRSKICSV